MLTKERYMTSLESIADYAYSANIGPNGIDVISRDFDELKKLIEEHFTPQPLKFEELHENMWVYDVKNKCCNFEENRYYPIIIPTFEKRGINKWNLQVLILGCIMRSFVQRY